MSDIAIRAEGLSKRYNLGTRERYRTLRDSLTDTFTAPFRRFRGRRVPHIQADETFWALKDVSFQVKRGEVIGFIGRNGAGKSTLLKILSRITEPTEGQARIHGRIASLLEVGTGFHPELTGRDNIYLNGAILGMKKAEIQRKFDEIVAFAEVDKFIDTPVKHYSSGMYVRLAFAVAAHLTVELLFIDEVLAVGDADFQKKCLGKMSQTTRAGRTVLFVSHNMTAMRGLCDRVIWLENGRLVRDGEPGDIIGQYLANSSAAASDRMWHEEETQKNRCGYLRRARLHVEGEDHIDTNTTLNFEFEYVNKVGGTTLNFSLHLYNIEGVCIFNSVSPAQPAPVGILRGRCVVSGGFLNDGQYRIRIMVVKDTSVILFDEDEALVFAVHDAPRDLDWYGKWTGIVRPVFPWTMSAVHEEMPTGVAGVTSTY
jgi:lipopolysaccharide transport system ATP-binding protein